jgi:5-methyltetrahydropteroyltriglutamate--homocysteine methyltransferase
MLFRFLRRAKAEGLNEALGDSDTEMSMFHGTPNNRAHHIGSFLRPQPLRDARQRLALGTIDAASFKAIEDDCITSIVRYQEALGFDVVTDGEFRRLSWRSIVVERVPGFCSGDSVGDLDIARDVSGSSVRIGSAPTVTSILDTFAPITGDDLSFLIGSTARNTKATLPSPSYLHFLRGDRTFEQSRYRDREHFFHDLVDLYCNEIDRLAALGVSCIQLDEVALTAMCDPDIRKKILLRGDNADALIDSYVTAIMQILARKPKSVLLGIHMCRGNYCGKWIASGSYDYLRAPFFEKIAPDLFFLEFDTARAGTFDILRAVARSTSVILGLINTKTEELENLETLARRVDEAASHIELDRLGVSPQCGFASHFDGNPVTFDCQTRKLETVVNLAKAIWGTT